MDKEQEVDKKIDEMIAEMDTNKIDHSDSVDESVDVHLQQMGYLWDRVISRLKDEDGGVCFECAKKINLETEPSHVLEAGNTKPGSIAFLLICQECKEKIEKKQKEAEVKKDGTEE